MAGAGGGGGGAIEIEQSTKDYHRFLSPEEKKSLESLTHAVDDGDVFGFFGPLDGAGNYERSSCWLC